jgi:type II secretory pathway component PulF
MPRATVTMSYGSLQRRTHKMPLYSYTARSDRGAFVAGSLEAESIELALSHLRMRLLFVTSIHAAKSAAGSVTGVVNLLPISAAARLGVIRSLATLVRAGVPLRRALSVTIDECNDRRLAEALRSIARDIEAGSSLSTAMGRRPLEFSELHIAMIRAGEIGGVLDEVLERLASMLERDRAMRKRLSAALAYPTIVSVAAIALVLFLIANITPAFSGLFEQLHVQLPLSTRVLVTLGRVLSRPEVSIGLIGGCAAAYAGVGFAWRQPSVARHLDRLALSTPIVGPLLRSVTTARLSRTLGTLLRSGVALLPALDATEGTLGRIPYQEMLQTVRDRLREGLTLAEPFAKSKLFSALFVQLVHVGEETGTLDAMLLRIAEYVELDVETAIASLGSVLEPALIVLLGTIVGTIVASVLLPLYSIIGSIT